VGFGEKTMQKSVVMEGIKPIEKRSLFNGSSRKSGRVQVEGPKHV
jgi:hypothetical protein